MAERLPFDSAAEDYLVTVPLDGVTYRLRVRWNGRAAAWLLDLLTDDGTPIVHGRRLAVGHDIWQQARYRPVPPGVLIPYDTERTQRDPGRQDLGGRVVGLYVTLEELRSLAQEAE